MLLLSRILPLQRVISDSCLVLKEQRCEIQDTRQYTKKKKNLLFEFQNFYKTLYAHGSLSKKKKKNPELEVNTGTI